MASKNYCLKHTKPLFTEQKIMNLENLHMYHTFKEIFKILKFDVPQSIKIVSDSALKMKNFVWSHDWD